MAKKMNPKRPRNYAANEATLINVRALKKEVKALTARVTALEAAHDEPEAPAELTEDVETLVDDDPLSES